MTFYILDDNNLGKKMLKISLFKILVVFTIIFLFIIPTLDSVYSKETDGNNNQFLEKQSNLYQERLFDLKIRTLLLKGGYPSLSGCIIKNDTVVWSKGYG